MAADTIHRIYTEEKNKRPILHLAAKSFESFTVQPTLGYYRGRPEKSIVIEIIGATAKAINALARKIRKMNGQIRARDQADRPGEDRQELILAGADLKPFAKVHEYLWSNFGPVSVSNHSNRALRRNPCRVVSFSYEQMGAVTRPYERAGNERVLKGIGRQDNPHYSETDAAISR